jgi:hypothetical protein
LHGIKLKSKVKMQSLLCFSALNPKTRSETRFRLRVHFGFGFHSVSGSTDLVGTLQRGCTPHSPLVAKSLSDGVIRAVEMDPQQMLVSVPMLGTRLCVL